ncbi:MAG: hypothetical protein IPI48_12510 [bacterium]|nr:hypothetical protein [bacterium]
MLVAQHRQALLPTGDNLEQMGDILQDCLGVRPSVLLLEALALALLGVGHGARAAHLAVGEVDEEIGAGFDGRMVVKGPELGMLGHAIDDDGGNRFGGLHLLGMVQ